MVFGDSFFKKNAVLEVTKTGDSFPAGMWWGKGRRLTNASLMKGSFLYSDIDLVAIINVSADCEKF